MKKIWLCFLLLGLSLPALAGPKAGDTYYDTVIFTDSTGTPAAATGVTASLIHNGAIDGAVTPTIGSALVTGVYPISSTLPGGYTGRNNSISYYVTGTVAGITVGKLTNTLSMDESPTNYSSLAIDGSGRVDIGKILGTASAGQAGSVGIDWAQVANPTNNTVLSATIINSITGSVGSISGITFPTNFSALSITSGTGRVDIGKILGTTSVGTAGYVGLDWGHITAPTTTVALTNTTISASSAPTAAQIATQVWQDTTASSDFSTAGSVGLLLKTNVDAKVSAAGASANTYSGTAAAGSASTITLPGGASAVDSFYVGARIALTGGTGSGQLANIIAYNGTTKVVTISNTWTTLPDNTTTFTITLP